MPDQLKAPKIICRGGVSTNEDVLTLSEFTPGMATRLLNFEVSQKGGYRKIDGYNYIGGSSDPIPGTGAVLGVFIHSNTIYGTRTQSTGSTYEIFPWTSGSGWASTGINYFAGSGTKDIRSPTNVNRIRVHTHTFTGTERVVVVDGVNYPGRYDGSTWDLADATTDANAAKFVTDFKNHTVYAGMSANPQNLVITAPNTDNDFTVGNGAATVNTGITITGIAVWRESLYVFGEYRIKRLTGNNKDDWQMVDVTDEIGCIASDSILELGGDVIFLSQDGVRTISGTDRIGDVGLDTISENIKSTIIDWADLYDLDNIVSVPIRKKTQFRYFVYDSGVNVEESAGLIGGIRYNPSGQGKQWEFGDLLGIKANCAHSGFINGVEYILHGDDAGEVYRQENLDTSFVGANIIAIYRTPYLDFGNTETLKDFSSLHLFFSPEGVFDLNVAVSFDWDDPSRAAPSNFNAGTTVVSSIYDDTETKYDTTYTWDGQGRTSKIISISGNGSSAQFRFVSNSSTNAGFSIQGFVTRFLEHEMRT